ncbi:hypothetical protein J6590_065545 [Homalodisca vitripennis]|nr:hypothetical protein J6590_065545 [Homalodisca vitripennis]
MDCAENSTEIVDDDSAAVLFRDGGRIWIHRGLQPLFCVVGLVGNLLTVVVLTRPRMRSSTNTYLAALALSDIAYLVTTWILTAEHYPDNKGSEYFWLWRHWGCLLWLHDAFSYFRTTTNGRAGGLLANDRNIQRSAIHAAATRPTLLDSVILR